jgi:hypothetical protein
MMIVRLLWEVVADLRRFTRAVFWLIWDSFFWRDR